MAVRLHNFEFEFDVNIIILDNQLHWKVGLASYL